MKKVIMIIGILILVTITILNVLYTTRLEPGEITQITYNGFVYIIGLLLLCGLIFFATNKLEKFLYNKEKAKKILWISAISLYCLFNIIWVLSVRIGNIGDTGAVCDIAKSMYYNDTTILDKIKFYAELPVRTYIQMYHQQIPLAFLFSILLRIINSSNGELIRGFNVIANALTFYALFLISKQISKKYNTNKTLLTILILTFFPLSMLSTFVYGDVPSLTLGLYSIYFIIKYTETNSLKYAFFSGITSMFAYMFRMNSIIFVIGIVIYLMLNVFKEHKNRTHKENLLKIVIIASYIIISITPSMIVKNYYLIKNNLDPNKSYPIESYFLMAMEEAPRGNGWYNEKRGEYALKNSEQAKVEYKEEIKERLHYFSKNIGYTFDFYIKKITSMWAENTYSAINANAIGEYENLNNATNYLLFYQKILLLLICICSLIVILQNKKNISLEMILLLTIFIGGFVFHILWEAKSRYIIPYIVILMPIASINIKSIKDVKLNSKTKRLYK